MKKLDKRKQTAAQTKHKLAKNETAHKFNREEKEALKKALIF